MFEEHFGLTAKPFGKTPDPAFLYESRQHKEALARLEYAVDEKELALLTGDIGSGKTTLSRALIDRLRETRAPPRRHRRGEAPARPRADRPARRDAPVDPPDHPAAHADAAFARGRQGP